MKSLSFGILILFLLINTSIQSQDQSFDFAIGFGGVSTDLGGQIEVDRYGNIIFTCMFKDTVDFDPSPSTFNLISEGDYDIAIVKMDKEGSLLYAKQIGNSNLDQVNSIELSENGNLICAGYFLGTVDFDPNNGTHNLSSSGNGDDGFILSLDKNGDFLWVKKLSSTQHVHPWKIMIDTMSNIFIVGSYLDSTDFDPSANTVWRKAKGNKDAFLCKLDSNGNYMWDLTFGSVVDDEAFSLVNDNQNQIYVSGSFNDTLIINTQSGTDTMISKGGSDLFYLKVSSTGAVIWAKQISGQGEVKSPFLTIDHDKNIYSASTFNGVNDFDPSNDTFLLTPQAFSDIALLKLDSNGEFIWAKQIESDTNAFPNDLVFRESGDLILLASFNGYTDVDPSINRRLIIQPRGDYDMVLISLSQNGSKNWSPQIQGSKYNVGYGLGLDSYGNVLAIGSFEDSTDFNSSTPIYPLRSNGDKDIFILKLTQCPYFVGKSNILIKDSSFASSISVDDYQWLNCDSGYTRISGATDSVFYPSYNGSFALEVEQNGCIDTTQCEGIFWIGQRTHYFDALIIFPNPVKDMLTIKSNGAGVYDYLLKTLDGKVVSKGSFKNNGEINMRGYQNGIYLISLCKDGKCIERKIVKH